MRQVGSLKARQVLYKLGSKLQRVGNRNRGKEGCSTVHVSRNHVDPSAIAPKILVPRSRRGNKTEQTGTTSKVYSAPSRHCDRARVGVDEALVVELVAAPHILSIDKNPATLHNALGHAAAAMPTF